MAPSIFDPAGLMRESRRQNNLPAGDVPEVCLLDPDGDLFRELKSTGAERNPHWACYHSEMMNLILDGRTIGVVGCAVGASYAVLVAEQLFVSGCRLLISVTSAGQIVSAGAPPYFVLIERALRDEGTSHHYLPPSAYVSLPPSMSELGSHLVGESPRVIAGGVWTTDAPFRETAAAVDFARSEGLLAVDMEAAALYALAQAKNLPILCFARVTNQMATVANDFEKGEANGNTDLLELLRKTVSASGMLFSQAGENI
jgi:uridine phosphorylase